VATEPFTDFAADRVSRLSITRTYNSSDVDLRTVGTGGVFANAWHHNWEASLSCASSVCTVKRGLKPGFKFSLAGSYPSLDGTETWNVYRAYAPPPYQPAHRHVLVQRPGGEWIVFLTSGRQLHFRRICTSCDTGTPYCQSELAGGKARLVKSVDPRGNAVHLTYDKPSGLLLRLTDDLGHALELRSSGACLANYASELRYDGVVVARYTTSMNLLQSAVDAGGRTLRSYVNVNLGAYWPRLQGVLNEAGTAVAEFSYDSSLRAVGVVDAASSAQVSYQADGTTAVVTEYYRGRYGDTSTTGQRQLDWNRRVTSVSDGNANGGARTLVWTPSGQLQCSRDAEGRMTFRELDALGRVIHSIEYRGDRCEVPAVVPPESREEWRAYGVVKAIAQGLNLDLDAATLVSRRSGLNPAGQASEAYDFSQAPAAIDPPGYACSAAPLPAGSVVCRRIDSGYVSGAGPVLERHATFYSYDAKGRLVRTYGPVNLDQPGANDVPPVEERTYWADGENAARQGRLHEVKRYATPASSPLVTSYDYDLFGVSSVTAPDGVRMEYAKDVRGRVTLTTSRDASGTVQGVSETRYYDGTKPRLRILPGGAAERYTHDGKGRFSGIERLSSDPEAPGANPTIAWSEVFVHDQAGNRIHAERRDGQGRVTWQQDSAFDVQHRVVWESHPGLPGVGRVWTYSPSGFLSGTVDEEGRGTSFVPDALNRVQKVQRSGFDGQGQPTTLDVASYLYAPNRDVLDQVTDGAGRAVGYAHDDLGRVERVTGATLGGSGVSHRYDARGNMVSRQSATVNVSYAYDGLDRLTWMSAQRASDNASVTHEYRYDERGFLGRLTSAVDAGRTVTYSYDPLGRLESEVVSESGVAVPLTTTYAYDTTGALRQVTYPSGLVVVFDRDPATGQVTAVRNAAGGSFATGIVHDLGGAVASLTFGNGRTLSQTFNLRSEPLSVASGPLSLGYTPTPAGDIGAVSDQSEDLGGCVRGVTRTFRYDFLDRLAGRSDAVAGGAGICPAESLGPVTAAFTYVEGTDRVAAQWAPDLSGLPVYAFGYDLEGSISAIGRYDAAGTSIESAVCLRHDPLGRLTLVGTTSTAVAPGGTACTSDAEVTAATARFRYDGRARRVARQVNGQWTHMVSDWSGNPLSELLLTGSTWTKVRDYVWLEGRLLAQVEYDGSAAYTYYAHLDHLGTPRALTNQAGELVWSTFQRPHGEVGEKTVTDPLSGRTVATNLRLPGQYDERLLGSLGLQGPYYNWNRWYLPGVGRYLELDPVALKGDFNGESGPDWYSYGEDNPLIVTDRAGLYTRENQDCISACILAGGACMAAGAGICWATGPGIPFCGANVAACCSASTLVCTSKCNKDERKRCRDNPTVPGCGTNKPPPKPPDQP
jgi:RHS repeat-associated protein